MRPQGDEMEPKPSWDVRRVRNAGSPKGRGPQGDGGPVVVGGRESRPQGEGGQVDRVSRREGTRDAKSRNRPNTHRTPTGAERPMRFALDDLQVATPCTADWDGMAGDDRVRFCSQCHLHVYDLSALTAEQATALLREKERTPCVRFYRRRDGTIMTADCPIGIRRLAHYPLRWAATILGVTFAVMLSVGASSSGRAWVRRMTDGVLPGSAGAGPCGTVTMGLPARPLPRAGQGPAPEKQAGEQPPQDDNADHPRTPER